MLVGERRNGNLLVQLDTKLQAQPVELLRQRWSPDGRSEYLIRWSVQNMEELPGNSGSTSQAESKTSSILMWMSAEEVYTNCPTLLGKRKKNEGSGMAEEKTSGSPDEGALQEMTDDVRMLVQRASRQMSQSSGPDSSILNTIHVLSAYASIGSLAGVFKETGALDLLMKMLCNSEKQIRKNAGKMLRALASHDAGSRAHVLLSLSQQDGIEQHMDFESRYTLLQLFAETTSSEEHCISFEGIHLPQIPGKQLFSLVKRYLCVTSLLDQLSSDRPHRADKSRLQRQFDFSMAMGSLICELVRAMGWVSEDAPEPVRNPETKRPPRILRSIFQPKAPPRASFTVATVSPVHTATAAAKKKSVKMFFEPSDFASRGAYVDYVQEALKPGMSVRMLEDYDEIGAGDEGVFRQSNNGMPPVQVLWRSTGRTYWVHWHMVQIIGEQAEEDGAEKTPSTAENVRVSPVPPSVQVRPGSSLYALPYLGMAARKGNRILRQDEWWEILFFIRRLEPQEQQEVQEMIQHGLEEEEEEMRGQEEQAFIQASVSVDLAQKILAFLSEHFHGHALRDLQNSHIYAKYILRSDDAENLLGPSGSSHQDHNLPGGLLSKKPKSEEPRKADKAESQSNTEPSILQVLHNLLSQEGLQVSAPSEEKGKGSGSSWGSSAGICLELLAEMLEKVKRSVCGVEALSFIVPILEQQLGEEAHGVKVEGRPSCREKIVKLLVELLTAQVKEKLLVVTCLQLAYLVMSKYDCRVLFATEGGVRAVLAGMQEHESSPAVQHIGLAVLKVLTAVGSNDLPGASRRFTLNPGDAQVIKEIFSSIGSAAVGASTSLLRAIPGAIVKMMSVEGCSSSVYNGLLVVRMLTENHKALSEQLSGMELSSVLQSFAEDSRNSMYGRLDLFMQKQLSDLLKSSKENGSADNKESAPALAVQEMDMATLLTSLKDSRMSRDVLPSLERCFSEDVSALRFEVSQLLSDSGFFLQLLSCLEQLKAEKWLQLCIYRIMNKSLDFYQEDTLPWHRSIELCLTSLGSTSSDQESPLLYSFSPLLPLFFPPPLLFFFPSYTPLVHSSFFLSSSPYSFPLSLSSPSSFLLLSFSSSLLILLSCPLFSLLISSLLSPFYLSFPSPLLPLFIPPPLLLLFFPSYPSLLSTLLSCPLFSLLVSFLPLLPLFSSPSPLLSFLSSSPVHSSLYSFPLSLFSLLSLSAPSPLHSSFSSSSLLILLSCPLFFLVLFSILVSSLPSPSSFLLLAFSSFFLLILLSCPLFSLLVSYLLPLFFPPYLLLLFFLSSSLLFCPLLFTHFFSPLSLSSPSLVSPFL